MTDPIADLLTRIRNASRAGHLTVNIPASKTKRTILEVLKTEGYLDKVEDFEDVSGHKNFKVYLRFSQQGRPIIRELTRLSRSGKRVYVGKEEIRKFRGGLGMYVVSTSKGMLTDSQARELGVGGELVCSIF